MIKLPRLPVNWDKQPQLFERYWNTALTQIETNINEVVAAQAAAATAQADANTAQTTATAAQLSANVLASRQINTSGGLQGGGDLTADRSLSIIDVMTAGTYTFTVGAQSLAITVNAKGQVTNIVIV